MRSRLSRLAVVVSLGLLTTWAVCWTSALAFGFALSNNMTPCGNQRSGPPLTVARMQTPGGTLYISIDGRGTEDGIRRPGSPPSPLVFAEEVVPAWCRGTLLRPDFSRTLAMTAEARGWPCRALWDEDSINPGPNRPRGGGFELHLP